MLLIKVLLNMLYKACIFVLHITFFQKGKGGGSAHAGMIDAYKFIPVSVGSGKAVLGTEGGKGIRISIFMD